MNTILKVGAPFLALALAACEEPKPPPPPPVVKAEAPKPPEPPKPMSTAELASTFQQCWKLWNEKKWDQFAGCYSEDAASTQLGLPKVSGKAKILEMSKGPAAAFPDGKGELQMVLATGRDVTGVFYFHGTHTAPLKTPAGEVPATNKKVGYMGLHRVRFDDHNTVAEEWWAVDQATQAFQLGLSPQPARALMEKAPTLSTMVIVSAGSEAEKKMAADLRRTIELWNKRDKAAEGSFADDLVLSSNAEPADVTGKKAVLAHFQGSIKAFSDMHIDVDEAWGIGNYTVSMEHMRGTNDGNMGKMKKTGKAIDVNTIEVAEWKDGKIVHMWPFSNSMQMATQLGMVPEPGKSSVATQEK